MLISRTQFMSREISPRRPITQLFPRILSTPLLYFRGWKLKPNFVLQSLASCVQPSEIVFKVQRKFRNPPHNRDK